MYTCTCTCRLYIPKTAYSPQVREHFTSRDKLKQHVEVGIVLLKVKTKYNKN